MSSLAVDKLLELIEKSKLVEPEDLQKALTAIRADNHGELPESASQLAKELHARQVITRWHAEKLLKGKYKGFFLGKHKLLGHLGSGGMSSVYLAKHTKMHDLRAIKVLPQSRLGKSSYLKRFQQEAKAIASLNHPNIVRAYDIDNEGDNHYIVMEYVTGSDLQTIVRKKGPLPFHQVADFISQAARGLQHAHDVGLIHRDIKPANVLVNTEGNVKLLDLGLALVAGGEEASLTIDYNDKVLGTADYLAPEQALNSHGVDHRADLYGLGCTMYYLLVGHPPFPDGTIAQRIAKHQKSMPTPIRELRPDCPGELEGICWKLIQKDPKFRYASAAQTADVLDAWLAKYNLDPNNTVDSSVESSSAVSAGNFTDLSNTTGSSLIDPMSSTCDSINELPLRPLTTLSASDSGVLMKVDKQSLSDTGSRIDLHNDVSRRVGSSTAVGRSLASSSTGDSGSTLRSSVRPSGLGQAANSASPIPSTGPKILWILGFIFMFILAVFLGIFIARMTETKPPVISPALPGGEAVIKEQQIP